jgi:hypothetical protein
MLSTPRSRPVGAAMLLSLEDAAKLADLTLEELQKNIQEGHLATVANTGDEDTAQVDEKNLKHFINKRSFNALWSDAETTAATNQADAPAKPNGSLRRVLTIEAVADLKIQNRILTARIDTLERLFSEFIEREKEAESTLLLNDDWKIDGLAGLGPQEVGAFKEVPPEDDKALPIAQVDDKVEVPEYSPEAAKQAKQSDVQKIKAANEALKAVEEPTQPVKKATKPTSSEPSVGAGLTNLKNKLKGVSKNTDDLTEEVPEEKSDISAKLRIYEQRLAEAKETATRIWN